jgi:Kef-type K+ transport system membrane component KefB
LFFAYVAGRIGLAAIAGAFAAGLVLEPVDFRHFDDPTIIHDLEESVREASPELKKTVFHALESLARSHIQELVKPVSYFLLPIFLVLTGMQVQTHLLMISVRP